MKLSNDVAPAGARRWFRRRSVGLGWRPVRWQGWLVSLAAAGGVAIVLVLLRHSVEGAPAVVGVLAVYVLVVLFTGGMARPADAPVHAEAVTVQRANRGRQAGERGWMHRLRRCSQSST
jgi:hypothetical protein